MGGVVGCLVVVVGDGDGGGGGGGGGGWLGGGGVAEGTRTVGPTLDATM